MICFVFDVLFVAGCSCLVGFVVWLLVICVVVKDRLFWVCCCDAIAVFGFLVVWWPDCLL